MHTLLRKLRTLSAFSPLQFAWLIPAYLLSGCFRAMILTMPFRYIAPLMGMHHENAEITTLISAAQETQARQIATVVQTATKYTPWESKCLVQALVATLILRLHHIPHIAYLGVSKNEEEGAKNPLQAHAWVSSGRCFVSGGNGHRTFTVVSSFVSHREITTPLDNVV